MFKRLVATSRAPQIIVSSMLRSFSKIGPQIDQIWAWLSRGHRWSPGVRNPLKSSVTGPSLLVNCYLEIKFHKIIRVTPPLRTNKHQNFVWGPTLSECGGTCHAHFLNLAFEHEGVVVVYLKYKWAKMQSFFRNSQVLTMYGNALHEGVVFCA